MLSVITVLWQFSYYVFTGKSTVAALLERFYDVSSGEVTIDGINIKELDPSWLRKNVIGYIDQVCFMCIFFI